MRMAMRLGLLVMVMMAAYATPSRGESREKGMGIISALDSSRVEMLRGYLDDPGPDWGIKALSYYFGRTYLPELPDIVVYVGGSTKIKQQLIVNNKSMEGKWPRLSGEKYIYVLVFVTGTELANKDAVAPSDCSCPREDRKPPGRDAPTPVKDVRSVVTVHRSSLDYRPDPFIRRAVGVFGDIITKVKMTEPAASLADTITIETLCDLGSERGGKTHLFLAFAKMRIAENTWTRISVCGDRVKEVGGARSVITNFSNAPASPYEIGVAAGAAWKVAKKATTETARVSVYLYGTRYIYNRPTFPRRGVSVGLTFGTNVTPGAILDDIMLGLSAKYKSWPTVICGGSLLLRSGQKAGDEKRRVGGFLVGLGFEI
jgi:hypothetical protein